MRIAGRIIKNQREKYGSDVVYLNVAGGRKNMCITLSILGQFLNVDGIFHIVSPDVKIVNEMLENLRSEDIERIYLAENEKDKVKTATPISFIKYLILPLLGGISKGERQFRTYSCYHSKTSSY